MANNPPTVNVYKYKGTGDTQVFPLLPTQLLGTQDGIDLISGLETPASGTFISNRVVEFLGDRFVVGNSGSTQLPVYRRDQGGAGNWGRASAVGIAGDPNLIIGIFVLHPDGVPTMAAWYWSVNQIRMHITTDGSTFTDTLVENTGSIPSTFGQALVFRHSLFVVHKRYTGASGQGSITQYDLVLSTTTRYDPTGLIDSQNACSQDIHVHDNVVFYFAATTGSNSPWRLWKLVAGSFVAVYTDSTQGGRGSVSSHFGHSVMFTDDATGDLIIVMSGATTAGEVATSKVVRIQNAAGSPTPSDITSTVLGSGEGADKYLVGGGSVDFSRRWSVFVDNDADPLNPRTFLWTWVPGGSTECWEWKGVAAEIEAVASLSGISDDFALPRNTIGGGHRSPRIAAVEIGDVSNNQDEALGGTKVFFHGEGSSAVGVVTFYGSIDEGPPDTVIPIVAASLIVESGSPPTTPSISGNTLTNFTPDSGVALYSVILDTSTFGLGEGGVGTIMPRIV